MRNGILVYFRDIKQHAGCRTWRLQKLQRIPEHPLEDQ